MIRNIIDNDTFTKDEIISLLNVQESSEYNLLKNKALSVLNEYVGDKVFLRGLVEFSNNCRCDCFYCGIRKSNNSIKRFILDEDEVINQAIWCADKGFGSFVIQAGEITSNSYIEKIVNIIRRIKQETCSEDQLEGLGITISLGEQSKENYKKLFDAGAHRYLLRIESSNKELFERIHPDYQKWENRIKCLDYLKEIGFQVGTGVMIGVPGQTVDILADDILFFKKLDIDMLGMGPFIVHKETPMNKYFEENLSNKEEIFKLSLKMIAVSRIVLKDVNIASTTALQAMYQEGRDEGLNYGANVIMPLLTPMNVRKNYKLYEGKPGLDNDRDDCIECIESSINKIGRKIGYNEYGDSKHYFNRK